MSVQPNRFEPLFDDPSIEKMYALSARDFEHFVGYVLHRAGYDIREVGPHFLRGVDVEMRLPGRQRIFGGVECKKFKPTNRVKAKVVMGVLGAPAVGRGAKPFVITTSDFVDAAHQMAEVGPRHAYLMNGAQLIRFITYIKHSLRDDENTITSLSPEFFAGKDQAVRRPDGGAHILTIANNKGGVGKTTTAYYLGGELARQGKRVLLIDLDGQANLTEWFFPDLVEQHGDGTERMLNITHYFAGQHALPDLVTPTGKDNLSIIPADPHLTLRDLGGSGRPELELKFAHAVQKLALQPLAPLGDVPEWIIIDTPPAMSAFTRAGLAAAQHIIAPMRPRRASAAGTVNMLNTLRATTALTGAARPRVSALVTHWDDLKGSEGDEVAFILPVLRRYDARMLAARIPIDNQIEHLGPGAKTKGARAYETVAEEVMRDVDTSRDTTNNGSENTATAAHVSE